MAILDSLIPQEKTAPVTKALREAFGVTAAENIRQMTRGNTSALVLRIVVQGTPFLLKIIMRPNTMVAPERQFICLRAAADAGLAPKVHYVSVEDGISITDFVEEVPLPLGEALVRLPALLRTLHTLPAFPETASHVNTTCTFLLHAGPARDGFIRKFREANALTASETEDILSWHAQAAAAYARLEPALASSHNDLFKPDNILFDGGRIWLVDWEAAFLNDRYADLAAAANLVIRSNADEQTYLRHYFGHEPDQSQWARYYLMRQVVHLFYTMAFLFNAGPARLGGEQAPDFETFHQRMWAGEINLADQATKVIYGRLHWAQLVQNMRQTRFAEALKILLG
jgi:Phosphotransferase enzyme family